MQEALKKAAIDEYTIKYKAKRLDAPPVAQVVNKAPVAEPTPAVVRPAAAKPKAAAASTSAAAPAAPEKDKYEQIEEEIEEEVNDGGGDEGDGFDLIDKLPGDFVILRHLS